MDLQLEPRFISAVTITFLRKFQFELDSNANALLDQALRAIGERKRGAKNGVCSPIARKALEKFRTQAQQHFNVAWDITWSKLPSKVFALADVASNSACSAAQVTSSIQSYVNETTGLGEVGVSALKPCRVKRGAKSLNRAFARIKRVRSALEGAQLKVNASVANYPQNVAVCR